MIDRVVPTISTNDLPRIRTRTRPSDGYRRCTYDRSGLEYGAQAMAIHGAWSADVTESPGPFRKCVAAGYLVAAFDLTGRPRMDRCATPLTIDAVREFGFDNQVAYHFELSAAGESIMRGRAAVVLNAH